MSRLFGKLSSDRLAEQNDKCRRLVKDIIDSEVDDRQIWFMIYLLGMNLENVDDLKMLTDFIKEYKNTNVFFTTGEE
jgi:hypothetical protein